MIKFFENLQNCYSAKRQGGLDDTNLDPKERLEDIPKFEHLDLGYLRIFFLGLYPKERLSY